MEVWFVRAVAERKLARLPNYRATSGETAAIKTKLPNLQDLPLRNGEQVLGIYENVPDELEDSLVITNLGLHLRRVSSWVSLEYTNMTNVRGPDTKTET